MNHKLHVLMLDFDGVTCHGWHHNPARRLDWTMNIEKDLNFQRQHILEIFGHQDYPLIVRGQLDLKTFLQQIFDRLGYTLSPDHFIDYWHGHDPDPSRLNQPLLKDIDDLQQQGWKIYLVSQQEPYRRQRILDLFKNHSYFDDYFFTCDFGYTKTDHQFYQMISDHLGTNPDRFIFFDDSPDYVQAAQQVGWQAHLYDTHGDFENHSLIGPLLRRGNRAHAF